MKTKKKTQEELDKRDEEIRRAFYRTSPTDGMLGLHGSLAEDVFGERTYSKSTKLQPVPARQKKR